MNESLYYFELLAASNAVWSVVSCICSNIVDKSFEFGGHRYLRTMRKWLESKIRFEILCDSERGLSPTKIFDGKNLIIR